MNINLSNNIKLCDYCKSNATCLCKECNFYFCDNCFKVIHDLKKECKHQKEKIDPFVPLELKCPIHPDHPMILFCITEKGKFNYFS